MSTHQDLTTRTIDAPTSPQAANPRKVSRLDLSFTKIMAGALAAMTAAALGSRLSVAGTLIGAAMASVVAAVASALYTASLSHTTDKVRTVWKGRDAGDGPADHGRGGERERPAFGLRPGGASLRSTLGVPPRRRLSGKSVAVGALAAFAIAAVALTGFELATGQALSGGDGTTVSQVAQPQPKTDPEPAPASSTASPSAEPTEPTASSTPTSTSPEASPAPSGEPSATQPATPAPTASATPEPTEPSGTVAPTSDPTG